MNSEPEESGGPSPGALWQAVFRQQQLQLLSHLAAMNPSLLLQNPLLPPEDAKSVVVPEGDVPSAASPRVVRRRSPPPREKVFTCKICERSFGYKHVLQNHERTHTGEKPFACKVCSKRFTRDHHLKTHMRLHTGEKPYSCSHCDRQFVQVANLRRHLRVHTGEKPYKCEPCGAAFSDSNQLKAHVLSHENNAKKKASLSSPLSPLSPESSPNNEEVGGGKASSRNRKAKDPKRINIMMQLEPQTEPEDLSAKKEQFAADILAAHSRRLNLPQS